jgi:hypothetical protein
MEKCCLLVVLCCCTSAHAADSENQGYLQVAISLAKDKAGTPVIDRQGEFSVELTNSTQLPIRLWSDDCELGYASLWFNVVDQQGQSVRMHRSPVSSSCWKDKPPQTITIAPGASHSWKVGQEWFWGERMWTGVPEPTAGQPIRLTAVFEIAATGAATKSTVWTGRVTSALMAT